MMRFNDPKNQKRDVQRKLAFKDDEFLIAKIVSATLVMDPDPDPANSKYIWRYEVTPATVSWEGFGFLPSTAPRSVDPVTSDPGPLYPAFSISELGNVLGAYVSYGVDTSLIPPGPEPVRIPDNTPVICRAMRNYFDGQAFYLIINTQAISGECE